MSIRRTPFDEMDRMFDQMRRSMRAPWFAQEGEWDLPAVDDATHRMDNNLTVDRDDEGFVVLADLPGFEKEELDLRFDEGMLSIRGRHEVSDESDTGTSMRSRSVFEQVRIPGDVVEDDISATYRNGVLEVRVPVETDTPEEDDSHRIDID
ncbi:Hsp20/alpha crystallin family protein [Halomarina rubra]|uniref:Hsp20/alpha crystallin family protein n=1 Tax=Halomarina rubra TaxID=2071873 RepID=A0ABD6AZB0_9EURY|nr:Hsp20/alpha crystallin family protein [Halomarina rubra]